jgi:fibronectin-binding autotransporter adhesin
MSVELSGIGQFFTHAAPVVSTMPLTLVGWVNSDTDASSQSILGISGTSVEQYRIMLSGNVAGDPVRALKTQAGVIVTSVAAGYTVGVWTHAAGIFTSATSMLAYKDGVAGTLQATSSTPGVLTRTNIGVNADTGNLLNGRIVHCAIYNVALSGADIAELAAGVLPIRLKSGTQPVAYWPLISASDITDHVGSFDLTATGVPTTSTSNPTQIDQAPGVSAGVASVVGLGAGFASGAGQSPVPAVSVLAEGAAQAATAGLSTASVNVLGFGATVVAGAGLSTGVASVVGAGATSGVVGLSAGAASVLGSGAAQSNGAGLSQGVASVTGQRAASAASVGQATGTAFVTGAPAATANVVGLSAGVASVVGSIEEQDSIPGPVGFLLLMVADIPIPVTSTEGVGLAAVRTEVVESGTFAVGIALADSVAISIAGATVLGTGHGYVDGVGQSVGVASVLGSINSDFAVAGLSQGVASVDGRAAAASAVVGLSSAGATVLGVGASNQVPAEAISAGVASVFGVGAAIHSGAGLTQAQATANARSESLSQATGISAGVASATGAGGSFTDAFGLSDGIAIAQANIVANATTIGISDAAAAVVGIGDLTTTAAVVGQAFAGTTAEARSAALALVVGTSDSEAFADGIGGAFHDYAGLSTGLSFVLGVGVAMQPLPPRRGTGRRGGGVGTIGRPPNIQDSRIKRAA